MVLIWAKYVNHLKNSILLYLSKTTYPYPYFGMSTEQYVNPIGIHSLVSIAYSTIYIWLGWPDIISFLGLFFNDYSHGLDS